MTTKASGPLTSFVAGCIWFLGSTPATAAPVVGDVAAFVASAEIERAGSWSSIGLGDKIELGDRIRTNDSGRVTVSFVDGSVATVSGDSELVIDEFVYDPETAGGSSLLQLLKGRVRTIVSDYYSDSGKFDVKTPTATAGVRGTDFLVSYDDLLEVTEVIGATGRVYVRSLSLASADGVLVTAGTQTTVAKGQPPTEPRQIGEERFRYYMDDLEFIGRGRREGAGFNQPVLSGNAVPPPDRAQLGVSGAADGGIDFDQLQQNSPGGPDAVGLAGEPPSALDSGSVGVDF